MLDYYLAAVASIIEVALITEADCIMMGFRYLKTPPTTFSLLYKAGKATAKGSGLSRVYFSPIYTLVQINLASVDLPFVFENPTQDFQDVTIQGQLTFRVADPEKLSSVMNYTVDARGKYVSDDPDKLGERLIQVAQVFSRDFSQRFTLLEVIEKSSELSSELKRTLADSEVTKTLGVEILNVSVTSIKASPEMAKALQADARERLLLKADEAVFARRNTAIELERQIKENELQTERAIEEKRRQVREAKMQADIAVESRRTELVQKQVENQRKLAEVQISTMKATIEAMQGTDWKTLMAASGGGNAKSIIAIAFEQLAENARRIGRLDISPDLLRSLLEENNEVPKKKS